MSKGLEAFNKFCDDVVACVNSGGIAYIEINNKKIVEKELKALEIINKKFKLHAYKSRHAPSGFELEIEDTYGNCIYSYISEDEYNLLKELK